jgi:hypothetical protein
MAELTYSNTYENQFWLQIIGDYARLLIQAFSPDQKGEIQQARDYINLFDNLLSRARQNPTADQLAQLNRDAYTATKNIQNFFLQMLSLQVRSGSPIFIKPTIISNAVTFTEEYLYLLDAFMNNKQPAAVTALQLEIYWLPAFIQIAKVITDSLGLYQVDFRRKADDFSNKFINLLLASMDLQGVSRIGTNDFPMQNEHHKEVINALQEFSGFLEMLAALCQQNRMPGSLSTLYLDRSDRLACYVLKQLAVLTDAKIPECDPTRPRICHI